MVKDLTLTEQRLNALEHNAREVDEIIGFWAKSTSVSQNIMIAIARIAGVQPDQLASALADEKANKSFEEIVSTEIKRITGMKSKSKK